MLWHLHVLSKVSPLALPWCRAKGGPGPIRTAPDGSFSGQAVPACTDDTLVMEAREGFARAE